MQEDHLSENAKALAIMAHDLKAPLSAVVSILDVINKGYITDMSKILELVERATQKTETLISMVDDILDYTLLSDKSMMKREKVNLFEVLHDTISTMNSYVNDRKLILTHPGLEGELIVFGNYTFLLRAFNNVVMNAIKYNKKNGSIAIDYFENKTEKTITVSVIDTGIGIPEDDKGKVFKIFERGRHARKNINGSLGLGLSLVRQIIEDHDGDIELSSTIDVGTTIKITLPLYKEGGIYES